jgi:hypothetical protein
LLLDLSGGIGFHPVSLAVFASLSNTCASDNLAAYQALEPLIYHGREDHLYKLSFLQTQLFPLHLTPTCVVAAAAWPARFVFLLAALLEEGATTSQHSISTNSIACVSSFNLLRLPRYPYQQYIQLPRCRYTCGRLRHDHPRKDCIITSYLSKAQVCQVASIPTYLLS